jgi:hypothetical protein
MNLNWLSPQFKTFSTILFFTIVGIYGALVYGKNIIVSLPLMIFYLTITVNTYYSMKLFTRIVEKHTFLQDSVDVVLVILYGFLAFNFDKPLMFVYIVSGLFIVATLKYVLLVGKLPHQKLLKNKIRIDSMGIIMGFITLILTATGNLFFGTWFLAITFGIANIILLFIWPMYKLEEN